MRKTNLAPCLLIAMLTGLAMAACVYSPAYEGTHCGPGSACPSGYVCDADEKICVRGDQEPDGEEPPEDGGQDAGDGELDADGQDGDGGQDAGDEVSDGGDVVEDGGDDQVDGGDEATDAGDEDTDGGDQGGDEGPCGGGCQAGQYCDEAADVCRSCSDPLHCGPDCNPCAEEESCINLGADGMCCLGVCDFSTACSRVDCNGTTYLCKAFFPLTYDWIRLADASALICALADQDGIVDAAYQCNPGDDTQLLYFCPWSGLCNEDGTCHVDMGYAEVPHDCGPRFGCVDGHCRAYLQLGQPCEFNFDCDSYCCARGSNSTCLDGSDTALCRIPTTFYRSDMQSYTWHALPQAAGADPHDLNTWWWEGGEHAEECANNADCDTANCGTSIFYSNKRCRFPACVADGEEATIRSHYFCASAQENHQDHILFVNNGDPWPDLPQNCVY